MAVLAALGGASFLLVCIIGGARLLLLARRTRELPELVLGTGLFLLGGVATPLGALARAPLGFEVDARVVLMLAQYLMMVVGMGGFAYFTHRVFRPGETWARALVLAVPLGMLVGLAMCFAQEGGLVVLLEGPTVGYAVHQVLTAVTLAWCAWESLRYAAFLRRRLRLGLADPVVADRVRLWGIAMAIATLLSVLTISGQLVGIDLMVTMSGMVVVGFGGLIAGSAIYLAFLPPAAYTRWVVARATRHG